MYRGTYKFSAALLLLLALARGTMAQVYTFVPSAAYTALVPMDQYTIHQVDIFHESAEPYLMSWRLVGNTCPSEWSFQLCDWASCYDGMPNTGNMDPIAPDGYGLLKLTVNPHTTPGSGQLTFWVFPTGQMDLHQSVTFDFQTDETGILKAVWPSPVIYPMPAGDVLKISHPHQNNWQLYSPSGQEVLFGRHNAGISEIPVVELPAGWYLFSMGSFQQAILIE
jgi:hypothetical protein